ncbi:MAG TPA: hypothetical protein ENJ56_02425, partial [Anaerolineae bacterium]|nr:hypothetical protein [Anaerolineae bacterium]
GQRNAALAQYAACQTVLDKELDINPEAATTQLFKQIRDQTLAQPAPIPFLPPAQVAHFIGRNQLLANLTATIAQQKQKIVALVGMGGIGKTTTAIHLAHQLRRNYEDGVLWANTLQSDSAEILTQWAAVYDVDLKHLPSLAARQTAWRGITENKRILLILDNVESAEEVRPILPNTPHCTVLITTRNHDVAYALDAHLLDLPTLEQQAAYGLLENIIGEARVSAEATAATSICEQLEYLPLALEIVAQRLHSRPRYTLTAFAQHLAETVSRLDPLTMDDRAVRASFELSWQLLSEALQHLFAGLAVFEGRSFSSEAMAYILQMGEGEMVDRLEDLRALSLLGSAEGARYRQHALLADFSAEKVIRLEQNLAHLETRLTTYFYQFAHNHAQDIPCLKPNWANIQTAIDICQRTKNWQQLIDFTTVMTPAWRLQGRYTEARRAYKMAYEAALILEQDETIATILLDWGRAAFEQNDFLEAKQYIEKSLIIFEAPLSNKQGATKSRYWLARIAFEQSAYSHAEDLLQHCIKIFRTNKDNKGIARVLRLQAQIALNGREIEKSHTLYSDALTILEGTDDPYGKINTMRKLADVKVIIGDIDHAESLLNAALGQC